LAHPVPARLSGPYTAAAGRKFGLTVGIAFLVLAAIGRWRGHPTTFLVLGILGACLVLGGLVVPTMLGPVERAWMKLAALISKVTTPIFMGVVYFIILTPIGLLRRMFAANPLAHKAGPHGFWADRGHSRSSLERQF
jgi:Saxitoxin biosynthesis operon protein SxtJ